MYLDSVSLVVVLFLRVFFQRALLCLHRELYFNKDGTARKEGETITDLIFARTLTQLAEDPLSFYNGSIAKEMVEDIKNRGGILTLEDLQNFTATNRRVLSSVINDDTFYTTSATTSGSTLIMILNILKGEFRP